LLHQVKRQLARVMGTAPLPRTAHLDLPGVDFSYLPRGWDSGWVDSLRLADRVPTSAGVLGASLEMGGSASTDVMTKGWWSLWAKGIIARGYKRYGDFFPPMYSAAWSALTVPSGWPWIYDLIPNTWGYNGPLFTARYTPLNNGGSPLCHFQHPNQAVQYNGLSFDIISWDPTGAGGTSWVFNLNGGANQTVNQTGSNLLVRTRVDQTTPGWSAVGNVINFVSQSAANAMQLVGVCTYPDRTGPGTSGVGFSWMAFSAMSLNELARRDKTAPADKIVQLQGPTNTSPPFNTGFGFPFNNRLLVVGVFDDSIYYAKCQDPTGAFVGGPTTVGQNPQLLVSGLDPEAFRDGIRRIRQANQALNGSMLFALGNVPSGHSSDVTMTGYPPQNADAYFDECYLVAQVRGCGVYSHHIAWGETGASKGYQLPTNVHATDLGNAARAADILSIT
jgi:hypothetical protein